MSYRLSNLLIQFRSSACCNDACGGGGDDGGGDDGGDGGGGDAGGGGGDDDGGGGQNVYVCMLMHGFRLEGQMQIALRLRLLQQQLGLLRRSCLNFAQI